MAGGSPRTEPADRNTARRTISAACGFALKELFRDMASPPWLKHCRLQDNTQESGSRLQKMPTPGEIAREPEAPARQFLAGASGSRRLVHGSPRIVLDEQPKPVDNHREADIPD